MLAQTFIHEPDLVFIDEPLVNLDPIMQAEVRDHLRDYCAAGNTLFLSTHFLEVAADLCTQIGIVREGRLVAERDPRDLEDETELLEYFRSEVDDATADGTPDAGEGTGPAAADGGSDRAGGGGNR
jgi:ABC-2 type transport system ATP-binding protein